MKMPKVIEIFLGIVLILENLAEILALPLVFTIIGIGNDFGYPYYLVTIGGYFLLFGIIQGSIHLFFRIVEKSFEPPYKSKLRRIQNKLYSKGKG